MFRMASATLLLVAVSCASAQQTAPAAPATPGVVPQITGIRVSRTGGQVQVEVRASGPATVRRSRLSNPDRIVIDFSGFQGPTRRIQVDDNPVLTVRTGMYQVEPPIARVVIDTSRMVPYQVRPDGNTTLISVTVEPSALAAASQPPAPKPRRQPSMPVGHILIRESPARAIKQTPPQAVSLSLGPLVAVDASGLITVKAEKCKFIDVLQQIAAVSGAQIEPADDQARNLLSTAGGQLVTLDLGPATSREVVKSFFQGSPLDYIVIESPNGELQKIVVIANSGSTSAAARPDALSLTAAQTADDVTPPTVALTSPAQGATVSGEVTLSAKAEDNVAIAGVQFNVDGKDLGAELTSEPYNLVWDTTSVAPGTHVLGATARDPRGNANNAPTVIVNVVRPD